MATKSIYKNVTVTDKSFGRALISALESAEKKKTKKVDIKKPFSEATKEQIKEIFGENK